jgi:hypothetical protein
MRATCPANLILLSLSFQLCLAQSESYEAPHYTIFSNLPLFHPYSAQVCRDQVPHRYKTISKILVLYITTCVSRVTEQTMRGLIHEDFDDDVYSSIFVHLDSRQEDIRVCTEWKQALLEFSLPLISS